MDHWIMIVLGATLALFLILAALPVEIHFSASLGGPLDKLQKTVRLRWAFGLVKVNLGRPAKADSLQRARGRADDPQSKKRRSSIQVTRFLRDPNARERIRFLLKRLFRAAHWRMFQLEVRFGFDNPADTGYFWSLLAPLLALIPSHWAVSVRPLFESADAEIQTDGILRLYPLAILWLALWFAASPSTWRTLWPFLQQR